MSERALPGENLSPCFEVIIQLGSSTLSKSCNFGIIMNLCLLISLAVGVQMAVDSSSPYRERWSSML